MKKKMKKLFSKLTILVLLVAMLIPYTSIPKVEAAETCEGGEWEYHTNYYFFTQAEHPRTWADYLATDDTTKAFSTEDTTANTYYTSFLYNFPSDGTAMDITSAGFVDLDMDGNVNKINSTSEWSVKGFYSEMLKMYDSSKEYDYSNPDSTYKEYSYIATDNTGKSSSDSIVTYLIHGPWGFAGTGDNLSTADIELNDTESIISKASYKQANNVNTITDTTIINALTAASVLPDENKISDINIGIASGSLGTDDSAIDSIKSAIKDFNRDKGKEIKGGIYKATKNKNSSDTTGDIVLKLYIRRSYETDDFFTFNSIRKQTGGVYMASSKSTQEEVDALTTTEKLYFPEIDNTCDTGRDDCNDKAYVTLGEGTSDKVSNPTAIKLAAESTDEYWFLAPSLFQISYKVCKAGTDATEDSVTLTYYGNEEYVNTSAKADKVPSAQTEKLNSEGKATFTVSATEPTLEGYTFQNWNTSKDCKGKTIEPETKLENVSVNTPLYACWGETGTTNNGKTGVMTYAGLFTGIIALAGTSYYIMKKKNVFKKI